jgi:hypothetical protein
MGDRVAYWFLMGRSEVKSPLGRTKIGWRIILKWTFKKWNGAAWTGLIWLRIGTGGGCL